ncbi:uncharacterized protein I206_104857 [Kwoniella pini CBS 10737]|uniref:Uncharacterized protein n=1 Tax=Kwoniella pini CBS 10737 TaxID=1296096 RepID=A0A1B9I7X5_9TREE|nr:uncharacterized protein I206_02397 [Kwoniella pini CBS 10737]OCF51682.1 hypothetical protein I206_02397 [Kwoniella pini CBS 10737]
MTSSILTSPFLSLNTIDTILKSPNPIPAEQKIQLLEAKIHLLVSTLPSFITKASDKQPDDIVTERKSHDERTGKVIAIDEIRIELGQTYLEQKIPDYIKAEVEFGIVDTDCKNVLKRMKRKKDIHMTSQDENLINPDLTNKNIWREIDETWIMRIKTLRTSALEGMIGVEEGLGRIARAERWKKAIAELR